MIVWNPAKKTGHLQTHVKGMSFEIGRTESRKGDASVYNTPQCNCILNKIHKFQQL